MSDRFDGFTVNLFRDDAGDWIASALRDGAEDAGREVGVGYAEPFRRIWLAP